MTGLAIFKNKHNYVMTYLYIMTFGPTSARRLPRSRVRDTHARRVPLGSFIGFSSAFPKLIVDIFDEYGPKECAELQLKGTLEQGDCSYTGWPVTGFSPAFLGALRSRAVSVDLGSRIGDSVVGVGR